VKFTTLFHVQNKYIPQSGCKENCAYLAQRFVKYYARNCRLHNCVLISKSNSLYQIMANKLHTQASPGSFIRRYLLDPRPPTVYKPVTFNRLMYSKKSFHTYHITFMLSSLKPSQVTFQISTKDCLPMLFDAISNIWAVNSMLRVTKWNCNLPFISIVAHTSTTTELQEPHKQSKDCVAYKVYKRILQLEILFVAFATPQEIEVFFVRNVLRFLEVENHWYNDLGPNHRDP
jgi:hypothetical protein